MQASRAQSCSIFGLSKWEFDGLTIEEGFPGSKKSGSRGTDWTVDTIALHKWLLRRALAAAGGSTPDDGGEEIDFDKERARLTKEQANKTEFEVKRLRKEQVSAAAMQKLLAVRDVGIKDRMMAVPMAAADRAQDASLQRGAVGIADVYRAEITSALSDLASAELVIEAAN